MDAYFYQWRGFALASLVIIIIIWLILYIQNNADAKVNSIILIYIPSMKTSEIKNFAIHLVRPIRAHSPEPQFNHFFTSDDEPVINSVYQGLKEARESGFNLSEDLLKQNYQLISRLKRHVEQQQFQLFDLSKIKYRQGKSLKKLQQTPHIADAFPQFEELRPPIRLKPLKINMENKSEIFTNNNKQNIGQVSDTRPLGLSEKPKLKKLPELAIKGTKKEDQPQQSNFHTLRNQIETLKELQAKVSEQNGKLRSMLKEMQNNAKPEDCQMNIKFKLIFQETINSKEEPISLTVSIPKAYETQKEIVSVPKQLIYQELVSHLQLMVVSQQKQIETMQSKLLEKKRGKSVPDRWTHF